MHGHDVKFAYESTGLPVDGGGRLSAQLRRSESSCGTGHALAYGAHWAPVFCRVRVQLRLPLRLPQTSVTPGRRGGVATTSDRGGESPLATSATVSSGPIVTTGVTALAREGRLPVPRGPVTAMGTATHRPFGPGPSFPVARLAPGCPRAAAAGLRPRTAHAPAPGGNHCGGHRLEPAAAPASPQRAHLDTDFLTTRRADGT